MQQQAVFNFSVPVRGRTPRARHASWTGARQAVRAWTWKQSQILQLLSGGPKSRQELSELTGIRINAICSSLDNLVRQGIVEASGEFEIVQWPDGGMTRRERFQIRRSTA